MIREIKPLYSLVCQSRALRSEFLFGPSLMKLGFKGNKANMNPSANELTQVRQNLGLN